LTLAGLTSSELRRLGITARHLHRLFHLIPLRERCLLRLVHLRGASQRELAGLVGISPRSVRRTLARARARLRDPVNLALVARWRRLDASERRLVYLYRLQGIPLRRLARLGLIPGPASDRPDPPASLQALRSLWRRLERTAVRAARRRVSAPAAPHREPPAPRGGCPDLPAGGGPAVLSAYSSGAADGSSSSTG